MGESTTTACNVCDAAFGPAVFVAGAPSITSMGEPHRGATEVFFCQRCGHLQSTAMDDAEAYYEHGYNILVDSDEEDQIYQVLDGRRIYRLEHQAETFLAKISPPPGAAVLDFGCAKAKTLQKIVARRPDLTPYAFDISEAYRRFWHPFVAAEHQATFEPCPKWDGTLDVVTSFFALEHATDPIAFVRRVASLLRPHGIFYCIVPDVTVNTADFVVVDHVNHFTETSLVHLLQRCGLSEVHVDRTSHEGALVVTAVKAEPTSPQLPSAQALATTQQRVLAIRDDWRQMDGDIQGLERACGPMGPAAIYGAGFWGSYVASRLQDLSRVVCFLDQNPFLHGKTKFGRPVVAPEHRPPEVAVVYVALRPDRARSAIESIEAFRGAPLTFAYLSAATHS